MVFSFYCLPEYRTIHQPVNVLKLDVIVIQPIQIYEESFYDFNPPAIWLSRFSPE
jgi:hypothetical protein